MLCVTRSACGQGSKGLCLEWDGPGKHGPGDQKGEEGKRTEREEREKVGGDKQDSKAGKRRKPVLPRVRGRGGGQSSISTTLSQLTQLLLCSKFPLISLHYLLSANHFSSCQLFPLLF